MEMSTHPYKIKCEKKADSRTDTSKKIRWEALMQNRSACIGSFCICTVEARKLEHDSPQTTKETRTSINHPTFMVRRFGVYCRRSQQIKSISWSFIHDPASSVGARPMQYTSELSKASAVLKEIEKRLFVP